MQVQDKQETWIKKFGWASFFSSASGITFLEGFLRLVNF